MRTCKACKASKPLDDFPPYKVRGKEGRRHTCRKCWGEKWNSVISAHGARYYHENRAGIRDAQRARARKRYQEHRAAHYARNAAYDARHPERKAARVAVAIAVRSGRLLAEPCSVCGAAEAHAHHDDYSQPLDVLWLCREHHAERHRLLNRFGDPSEWPVGLRVRQFPEVPT